MAKKEIKLTHQQGFTLYMLASTMRCPEKLGEESFDLAQRSIADDSIMYARRTLRQYSRIEDKGRMVLFGDRDNWSKKDDKGYSELIDPEKPVTVGLDDEAQEGIYWTLLLFAHPATPYRKASVADLDDVVWPVARELGMEKNLRKDLGLHDRSKGRRIIRDDSTEWEKKEEPAPVKK